ncbi:glycan biosynthesis hexose transferase WsfD [Cohnella kolymensis]|uniref:glycan biosynthesis hexose transferase WsfD n=1 Tax=Cohnella kolymensis TaxID=1590652 RepID=UPI0006976045|nr:hypothetical protein [Cohnella kolymensis]
MFDLKKDIRKLVAWITGIAAAALIIYLIMLPPVLGVADNGDFGRLFSVTGLSHLDPNENSKDRFYAYSHQHFGYGGYMWGDYFSTQIFLVAAAGLIGRLFNFQVFDIRVLGALYTALFLLAIILFVRFSPKAATRSATLFVSAVIAVCLLFVFGDLGYIVYFQSFFGEPYALIGLLLTVASALALLSHEKPSGKLLALFVGAAVAVATSKIQNAPLGFAFALLTWRMLTLRPDARWRRQVWIGAGILLLTSALMIVAAPDRLKHANLYQSIFYGVLKDSPDVAGDMKELGIPEKYAVLAGTNYFQKDTPIRQKDPMLRQEVLEKLSHKDIALFYLKHPGRFIHKLERAADNAMFIRPNYLGNYDQSAGKPPGAKSDSFSVWSKWKVESMPHSLAWFLGFYAIYFVLLGVIWWRNSSKRVRLGAETLAAVGLAGAFACVVPLIGDGEADLGKHLFMFNVCFDMMVISVVAGMSYGLAKLASLAKRRQASS